jgi:hypothetical protein
MPWPFWGFVVTILAGALLAGHQREAFAEFSLLFSYGYWILRLTMAYLLFVGCVLLLEVTPLGARLGTGRAPSWSWGWLAGAAALITLPLFTLSVTMLDLLLGLPELDLLGIGLASGPAESYSASVMASAFAMESLYHLDHLLLCGLIVLPRVVLQLRAAGDAAAVAQDRALSQPRSDTAPPALRSAATAAPAFLERFDPPLKGTVFAVQAQEHYVRVVTAEGAGCTLYRFGDALRELEGMKGLQVHRSFWVSDAGVASLRNDKRGLKIVLRNGEQLPVSARHAEVVQRRYGERLETVA